MLTRWAVKVSQIQSMRMVRFPRREEHWQARYQSRKGSDSRRTVSHSSSLEQASQRTVERVDTMTR